MGADLLVETLVLLGGLCGRTLDDPRARSRAGTAAGPVGPTFSQKIRFSSLFSDGSLAMHSLRKIAEDGLVDWTRPAVELIRRDRAFTPWPGLLPFLKKTRLKLAGLSLATGGIPGWPPGTVLSVASCLVVACGEGAVALRELQAEGRSGCPRPISLAVSGWSRAKSGPHDAAGGGAFRPIGPRSRPRRFPRASSAMARMRRPWSTRTARACLRATATFCAPSWLARLWGDPLTTFGAAPRPAHRPARSPRPAGAPPSRREPPDGPGSEARGGRRDRRGGQGDVTAGRRPGKRRSAEGSCGGGASGAGRPARGRAPPAPPRAGVLAPGMAGSAVARGPRRGKACMALVVDQAYAPVDLLADPRLGGLEAIRARLSADGIGTEPSAWAPLALTVVFGRGGASPARRVRSDRRRRRGGAGHGRGASPGGRRRGSGGGAGGKTRTLLARASPGGSWR